MADSSTIQERNQELARQINEEARTNPGSSYAGKYVGIANGQVVAVADDLDEVVRQLRQVESDPQKTFCLEAGLDYSAVQYIGSDGLKATRSDFAAAAYVLTKNAELYRRLA